MSKDTTRIKTDNTDVIINAENTIRLWQDNYRLVCARADELEAELDVANKESEEYLRKLTELEAELDTAFNKGMERAAEIAKNATFLDCVIDTQIATAELILKEIDK